MRKITDLTKRISACLLTKPLKIRPWLLAAGFALLISGNICTGADWPTYQGDYQRSGISSENLDLPLQLQWQFHATLPPKPAWPKPAVHDYWHNHHSLRATVTYDRANHVVVAGNTAYFSSSADDKIVALDIANGKIRWQFFTGGPVRLAPTVVQEKVYAGSDDGFIYCLAAKDGSLLWKNLIADDTRKLPGNSRMISVWPIRTGIVVDQGLLYCGAGLFPNEKTYLAALDAETGKVVWKNEPGISPQGYMLASPQRLYIPTGRTSPIMFDRNDGKNLGGFDSAGGAYALLVEDTLVTGPGRGAKQINVDNAKNKETLASFGGIRMVSDGQSAYMQSETELTGFNRKDYLKFNRRKMNMEKRRKQLQEQLKKEQPDSPQQRQTQQYLNNLENDFLEINENLKQCFLWTTPSDCQYSLIMAGNTLFAGGENKVEAVNTATGKKLWTAPVKGAAYGLAVAQGKLLVSTDQGVIHCFSADGNAQADAPIRQPKVGADPFPKDRLAKTYADMAEQIISETQIKQGYCLVLGNETGRLAYEIAQRSDLQIIAVEPDQAKVNKSRATLDQAGLYGSRITIQQGSLTELDYPPYFANLIVSEQAALTGKISTPVEEVYRVLRPYGAVAYLGQPTPAGGLGRITENILKQWLAGVDIPAVKIINKNGFWVTFNRSAIAGSGQWTQLYADQSHSACSLDQLRGPVNLQWFGEPGPEQIIDRHHRPMSSLVKDGRIFVPALDRIVAADAFNGTKLWELEVPNSRRIGVMKDSGQMLVADDTIYIASAGQCWAVDAATGARGKTFNVPGPTEQKRDWGYLNQNGNLIFGTDQKVDASFRKQMFTNDPENGSNILEGDFRPVIVGESLFCYDRQTGKLRWQYKNGAIMNSAITLGQENIYFAQSRNPEIINDEDGRVRIDHFCKNLFITALNPQTGEEIWNRQVQFPFEHIMFLNYAENTLLFSGTYNKDKHVYYDLYTYNADTGADKWHDSFLGLDVGGTHPFGTGGSHGEQWQHPVINGDTIFAKPYAYNLHTGKQKEFHGYRGGHGCGGLTASAYYLYGRGSNPRMYPIETDKTSGVQLTQVTRPGCWLNIIPANGLVIIPESSSGCTCSYSLQTSLAFAPRQYYSPPVFLPTVRHFTGSAKVTLADRNHIGTIHYTTDGTEPTKDSPEYKNPLPIDATTTIKAKTFWSPSKTSTTSQATFVKK